MANVDEAKLPSPGLKTTGGGETHWPAPSPKPTLLSGQSSLVMKSGNAPPSAA